MNWIADSIQGVLFVEPTKTNLDAFELWSSLMSTRPEAFQSHPDPNAGASMAVGAIGGRQIQLQAAPGRIDLLVGSQQSSPSLFPRIEDSHNALTQVAGLCAKLSEGLPVVRKAIVSNWFIDQPDNATSNEKLRELVPAIGEIPKNSTDVAFALNIRKKVAGQEMNRVARWSSMIKQYALINASGVSSKIEQPSLFLNLDVNSVPTDVVKPAENGHLTYNDLLNEQLALVKGGYAELCKYE